MSLNIITLSGVDGSGKSTQIDLLKKYLDDNGAKTYYFHAISFSLANTNKNFVTGKSPAVTKASWNKVQLRKLVFILDSIRFRILIKKLERDNYTHLVSDRYFFDTIINILFLSNEKKIYSFGVNLLVKIIKSPNFAFYIDISAEEIQSRDRNIEQGTSYIKKKIIIFKQTIKDWNIQSIDGERNQLIIAKDLQQKIKLH